MLRWNCIFGIAILLPALAGAQVVVPYTVTDGKSIEVPLIEPAGNWREGKQLYFDEKLTRCSYCHGSPEDPDSKRRNKAPTLAGVRNRLSSGEIRLWIAAPNVIDPETEMPGFYLPGQRSEPDAPVINGPRLGAQQIEDIVAYLERTKNN